MGVLELLEHQAAMRAHYEVPEWTEDERERMRAFVAIANELKDENGLIDEEELKRRLKEFLKKRGEL